MEITQEILEQTKILWDYLRMDNPLQKSDLIFCLGSIDLRSAERAAQIYLEGYSKKILFSGGIAHANDPLRTTWNEPEAIVFAKEAMRLGVPKEDILLETEATNTGENITKGYKVLQDDNVTIRSMILVQKPYMGRRTYATFKKQWPGEEIEIIVTSPHISFNEYFDTTDVEKEKIVNIMVGDLQRIKEYPARGFQIAQDIPEKVMKAYSYLVDAGFTKHLIAVS